MVLAKGAVHELMLEIKLNRAEMVEVEMGGSECVGGDGNRMIWNL